MLKSVKNDINNLFEVYDEVLEKLKARHYNVLPEKLSVSASILTQTLYLDGGFIALSGNLNDIEDAIHSIEYPDLHLTVEKRNSSDSEEEFTDG